MGSGLTPALRYCTQKEAPGCELSCIMHRISGRIGLVSSQWRATWNGGCHLCLTTFHLLDLLKHLAHSTSQLLHLTSCAASVQVMHLPNPAAPDGAPAEAPALLCAGCRDGDGRFPGALVRRVSPHVLPRALYRLALSLALRSLGPHLQLPLCSFPPVPPPHACDPLFL